MAPPGILSIDEHLDAVSTRFSNTSVPAFSPMSKRSSSPSRGVTTSIFLDHDYSLGLQQEHQQLLLLDCESSTDSNSYEEIDIACIDFDDFVSKTVAQMGDATGMDDSNYGNNKPTVGRSNKQSVDNSRCHLIGANDARLTENIHSNNTPPWFMDDVDDDFLDGLDNFDLELDDFDPCIDMDTEDSFQHFIEETLNSPTTNTFMDDEYELHGVVDEEEDTQRKEYFLKLLGLQSVSDASENRLAFPEDCDTNDTRHHTFALERSTDSTASHVGVQTSKNIMCQESSHFLPSSAISIHPSPLSPSVPAKMCSCAVVDWKDSLLYSTAPICSNGLVQTNLTTAPTKSIAYNNMAARNFCPTVNGTDILHPASSVGDLDNFEDLAPCSLLDEGGLQLKNPSDADVFLRSLEEDVETVSSTQASTDMSERIKGATDKNLSAQPNVEDANSVLESSHLSAGHSIPDMDSFVDLETYTMEKSPSLTQSGKDAHPNNYQNNPTRDANFDPMVERLGYIESKYPPSSELRFRLSLLDDLNCRKDRYLEKTDTLCQFGVSADDVNGWCKGYMFDDPGADSTSDVASSPLSPYSSSSVHSSYGQPKGEDSLDLLGLFSEENSFLLMEQSDSRYGFC